MAGGNHVLRDSVKDTTGYRINAEKDKSGRTDVNYTSGHTLTWEKTEVGDGKRLKEVRTLTKIHSPRPLFSIAPDAWDRIFGKKTEEDE